MIPFWKKTGKHSKPQSAQKRRQKAKPAVPRTAQQSIPMQRMFEDGTCRVKPNYYTRTIQYQDINYQLAQQEDKTAIFEEWCSFLNFFDSSIKFELSFVNMATDSTEFEKSIRIPFQKDGFDDVRAEYSQMLRQQLAKGNNGLTKTKFITFGVEGESMAQVKPRLDHIQNDLLNNFHRLGVQAKPLNGVQRLKLMHDMFNMDGASKFHFDWKDLVKSGLSVKDAIAPTAFAFKNSRTFQMGGIYGGDGQKMGLWVGAAWQKVYPNAPMVQGSWVCAAQPYGGPRGILLDSTGTRFCNEDMPYAFVCRAHNAQPHHMKWVFWDSKWETDGPAMGMVVCKDFRSPLHNPEEIQQFIEEGTILSADTIDELLAKMEGIDAETAKESIERYNELCAAGVDEDFGKRKQCLSSLTEPPFYGVRSGTTLLVTMGGLKINENQQVIDADAHPVEGLWAAGNCSGSFFFGDYPITISGASHGRACTGGRRAGQFAADRALEA